MRHPLTEARKRANLSQQALADKVGCDRQSILRIEAGRQVPTMRTVDKIITVLRDNEVELSADAFLPERAPTPAEPASAVG